MVSVSSDFLTGPHLYLSSSIVLFSFIYIYAHKYASCLYIVDAYEYASRSYIVDAYEYASRSYLVLWRIKRITLETTLFCHP